MTDTYHFEELDAETRDYLLQARDQNGKGLPGIYAAKANYLPLIGLLTGFGIIIATLIATLPPTDPPTKEAMLQTAGLLLGGWLVVAALRVWTAGKAGSYAGHFVYADPEYLYVARGGVVEVIDLGDLRDARAVQNFNEGNYQNTDVTVKVGKHRHTVRVHNEERGRRLAVYLNAVAYMRDGGEDGTDKELQNLSPAAMGALAKEVARTGEFPRHLRDAEDDAGVRVPRPHKEGRRSLGVLPILATVAAGAVMFVGLRALNVPVRDRAVYDRIMALPPKEQPPALRLYLANPDFTAHRAEAQQKLDQFYDAAVKNTIKGSDDDLRRGLSEAVLALKAKPTGVLALTAVEEQAPAGQAVASAGREQRIRQTLADKWGSTIGDELVVFATPADPDNPNAVDRKARGNIDLRWKYAEDGSIEYTIEFRTSPDEAPVVTKSGTVPLAKEAVNLPGGNPFNPPGLVVPQQPVMPGGGTPADRTADALVAKVLELTVKETRVRPPPPPPDVDF